MALAKERKNVPYKLINFKVSLSRGDDDGGDVGDVGVGGARSLTRSPPPTLSFFTSKAILDSQKSSTPGDFELHLLRNSKAFTLNYPKRAARINILSQILSQ